MKKKKRAEEDVEDLAFADLPGDYESLEPHFEDGDGFVARQSLFHDYLDFQNFILSRTIEILRGITPYPSGGIFNLSCPGGFKQIARNILSKKKDKEIKEI